MGFTVAVLKKFFDDRGPNHGVEMAYWGFFSAFSLLLVFVAILGFIFHGDPSFQRDVRDSVLREMPVIGQQIGKSVGSLTGNVAAIAIGAGVALWTGLNFTLATADAFDRLWAVPRLDRRGFLSSRLRGLLLLVVIGAIVVAWTAIAGLAAEAQIQPALAQAASLIASTGVGLLIFVACFRLLTAAPLSIRAVLPGAGVAAIAWLGLQALGSAYVAHVGKGSSDTYGGFAVVVGLLSWLFIGTQVTLIAAEVNVVLDRRLWPRALTGRLGSADERALRDAAEAEQRDPRQRIAVTFEASVAPSGDGVGGAAETEVSGR
ncbi:MAG TPA: YihY/virulence factor BrkB family protein [Solirubrobacteraceae bacterium]|nr:YihY/virulence factor BrkB family protein [Solirubrobacteraceae bacterium]